MPHQPVLRVQQPLNTVSWQVAGRAWLVGWKVRPLGTQELLHGWTNLDFPALYLYGQLTGAHTLLHLLTRPLKLHVLARSTDIKHKCHPGAYSLRTVLDVARLLR